MSCLILHHWLNRLAGRQHKRQRRTDRPTRQRSRLVLESLEGRCVPSTVSNLSDAGVGSLRQAIIDTPADGTVDFQAGLTGTMTLTTGELAIGKDLTIDGPGASVITVSGNNASRVFDIAATYTVSISGLTIANGSVTGSGARGAGIFNAGTLALNSSIVSSNSASTYGGGIYNDLGGTLTITNSTFRGNSSGAYGGGIDNENILTVNS